MTSRLSLSLPSYTPFAQVSTASAPVYESSYQDPGSGSDPYTFTAVGIGTADADRRVLAVVTSLIDGQTEDISSVTIGGISATELVYVARDNVPSFRNAIGMYIAAVPTGTTADIVLNYTGTPTVQSATTVDVYTIDGDITLHDSASDSDQTGSTADITLNAQPTGHIIVAGTAQNSSETVLTITGGSSPTTDNQIDRGTDEEYVLVSDTNIPGGGSFSYSMTETGGQRLLAGVSF